MLITRKSILTGITREMELEITPNQMKRWLQGELIQDVMPNLSPSEREFLMNGITSEEWNVLLGEDNGQE